MSLTDKEYKTQIMEVIKSQEDKASTIASIQNAVLKDVSNDKKLQAKILSLIDELALQGKLAINGETVTKLSKSEKRGRSQKTELSQDLDNGDKKKKKSNNESESERLELWKNGEKAYNEGLLDDEYLSSNPDRITRLFVGNLHRKITEEQMKNAIDGITYIKWMTDKQSGQFYGSTFVEMKDPTAAIAAVMRDKQKLMGRSVTLDIYYYIIMIGITVIKSHYHRPLKIYYCPPRPGDVWPPKSLDSNGNNGPPVQRGARREKTPKPDGCKKLFVGNLSYEIDDDQICEFFKDCGKMVGLRWLSNKDTGEFRVWKTLINKVN
jgi:nucleolin